MPPIDYQMTGRWLLAGWLAALALFVGAPSVDLVLSNLFWNPWEGFRVIGNPMWEFLRQRIWDLSILVFLLSPFAMWRALARRRNVLGLSARAWGFVFTLYLLLPGLLVNGFLKAYSGRARPATVTEFGGDLTFTPAWSFVDQCARNCSFVSGEVSAAVALALVILLWRFSAERIERWVGNYAIVVAVFIPTFIAAQRVVTGRHFVSDAVFAALVTLSGAWLLYAAFEGRLGWFRLGGKERV
ncbi:phosphatase PAP2 family protein [Sedimentimonas flavescens]|uniref:Phosphatase PAP2 family protein n=1 Tax=Sedimentimonas flavescens TaxID=2851012 RepID=A0ABT3A1Y7_9RHOB|nr:phosphatase PAP2 family protein [Sedimentimonas flavescens]MCV2879615.1 phosphatase PAP2 family protein [Sedimentimonas flavescens]